MPLTVTDSIQFKCLKEGWAILDQGQVVTTGYHQNQTRGLTEDRSGSVAFDVASSECTDRTLSMHYQDSASNWLMRDQLHLLDNGLIEISRSWTNQGQKALRVVLNIDVNTCFSPDFYFIPCVSHNGNPRGEGNEPKGLSHDGIPRVFADNRTSLPAASFSENSDYSVGIFSAHDKEPGGSSSSLVRNENNMAHRILWPQREEPLTYSDRDYYCAASTGCINIEPAETVTRKIYLAINRVSQPNYGWTKAYDQAWDIFNVQEKAERTADDVWKLGLTFAESLLEENDGHTLFNIGFLPEGNDSWAWRQSGRYEIGWCGQQASLATALIKHGLDNDDQHRLRKGIQVLDTWADMAPGASGLFTVSYSQHPKKHPGEPIADVCNLAWGSWYMMEARELLEQAGIKKQHWLDMALATCDFFVEHYSDDYFFGKSWSVQTGECVDKGGSIGAFMNLALIKAFQVTGKRQYLETAEKAYRAYAGRDLDIMQCTAGALDTCCVDKETCWPFLKAGLDLYELTDNPQYLEYAKKAAYYLLSWMMHFETVGGDSAFTQYGYKTFGGTVVSVQHHHLDPWGALIACDWIRLGQLTADNKWLERAQATWRNSVQCISDGSLNINGRVRPAGSQNEAYFHCNWHFGNSELPGNQNLNDQKLNNWLVAWPTAFRLITLMNVDDWSQLK